MNQRQRRGLVIYSLIVWALLLAAGVAYAIGLYLFGLTHGGP